MPKLPMPDWVMVSAPLPVARDGQETVLPFFCALVTPKRRLIALESIAHDDDARFDQHLLDGTSRVCTRRRMSANLSDVSCTSRVLVRSSMDKLPRGDNMNPWHSWS